MKELKVRLKKALFLPNLEALDAGVASRRFIGVTFSPDGWVFNTSEPVSLFPNSNEHLFEYESWIAAGFLERADEPVPEPAADEPTLT